MNAPLALESDRAAQEREEAAVLAKNEQLRANLLRSIGHDLRTPSRLYPICGNPSKSDEKLSLEQRCDLADAIYDDSLWLIDTVENLLAITRVEDGAIRLNLTSELIDEVIEAALSHVAQASHGRAVTIEHTDDILLVRIDVHLIMQVLTNLIMNAFKYTPEDSTVTISARREGAFVVVDVADDGPGVADCDKPHIFERFLHLKQYAARGFAPKHRPWAVALPLHRGGAWRRHRSSRQPPPWGRLPFYPACRGDRDS